MYGKQHRRHIPQQTEIRFVNQSVHACICSSSFHFQRKVSQCDGSEEEKNSTPYSVSSQVRPMHRRFMLIELYRLMHKKLKPWWSRCHRYRHVDHVTASEKEKQRPCTVTLPDWTYSTLNYFARKKWKVHGDETLRYTWSIYPLIPTFHRHSASHQIPASSGSVLMGVCVRVCVRVCARVHVTPNDRQLWLTELNTIKKEKN